MNKQQIVIRLSNIACQNSDFDNLQSDVYRFISDLIAEGITTDKTHSSRAFPTELRQEIIIRDHFACVYCNRTGNVDKDPDGDTWTIDHVIPYSKGGITCIDNGVLACTQCNLEKSDMTPAQYVRRLRFNSIPRDDFSEGIELQNADEKSTPQGGIELTEDIQLFYEDSDKKWELFCEKFFAAHPTATQSYLRKVMSLLTGRHSEAYKAEAFKWYHTYSLLGDPNKLVGKFGMTGNSVKSHTKVVH